MSIEAVAAKKGLSVGARIAEAYRRWRTRLAWRRNAAKRPQIPLSILAVSVMLASGCASLDNAYIAMDERLFDGSQNPQKYLVPEGYEVKAFVRDSSGDRVDITGWTVEEEMIKTATWTPKPLLVDSRGRKQESLVNDLIKAGQEARQAPKEGSGASAAEKAVLEAAKSEGLTQ